MSARVGKPGSSRADAQTPITWYETAVAVCSGALVTSAFTNPFDVVKVRMQHPVQVAACQSCNVARVSASDMLLRVVRHEGRGSPSSLATAHTSTISPARTMLAWPQGVGSLWSGLQPALVMSVPGTVLYFATYEAARDYVSSRFPWLSHQAPLIAGGGARLVTATVVSPIELMRTRMQAEQSLRAEGMIGGASALVRREGWSSLWRGLGASLWRDVPFSCLCALPSRRPEPLAGSTKRGGLLPVCCATPSMHPWADLPAPSAMSSVLALRLDVL